VAVYVDTSELQRWGGLLASEAAQVVARVTPEVAQTQAMVVARANAEVPRGATGALAGSIRPLGSGLRRRVKAGNARAYYARFQEFGTRKMAASPFLLKQANPGSQSEFERRVDDAIGKGGVYR
jgi:HK97 gp10 family phage protein